MALTNTQYDTIIREYNKKQLQNRRDQEARIALAEKELPELLSLLSKAPSLLFVDSYFVTEPYLQAFSGICPVAYLDDLQLSLIHI